MPNRTHASHPKEAFNDRAVFERTGRRLASEIHDAIAGLLPHHPTVRALAAYLELDPSICHRALYAAQNASDPLTVLERSPGVVGLRSFAESLARHGVGAERVQALEQAIEQFAGLVRRSGGSHAKLQRQVTTMRESPTLHQEPLSDQQGESFRKRMFQATAAWLGTRLDTYSTIAIARTAPDMPDHIEGAKLSAFIGHRRQATTFPLVAGVRYRSGEPVRGHSEPPGQPGMIRPPAGSSIIDELSTPGASRLTTHSDSHNQIQIVDRAAPGSDPVDTVVFCRMPRVRHPMFCNVPLFSVLAHIEQPCAWLAADVWLERGLASGAIPDACVAWVGEPLRNGQSVPWYHRLPGEVSIQLLSPRSLRPASGWSRQSDATLLAFDRLGWSISDFVGYRIEVAYPAWGSGAVVTFDYSRPRAIDSGTFGT
jgi:hypothetical protein